MKKYVKPMLIYESFEMSQQIATCEYDGDFDDKSCIFIDDNGISIFTNNCGYNGILRVEAYCYHSATSGVSVFNS